MKIVLDIKNEEVIKKLVDFVSEHKEELEISSYEEKDLNEELKDSLFEVLLMKRGLIKKKELSELIDEL